MVSPRPLPDWEKVHTELRRPHVTLMLVWLEYKEVHPDGYAYSQFSELYRRWRRHLDVVMRQEHKAGDKLFVDFPGDTIPIYDERSGQVAFRAELFVAVMGASSYLYAEAFPSQQLLWWVTAHVHTFEHLGGCPAAVVCDNLRSGVTRPHRYEPDVNATYQEMAAHYHLAILPARSYKPRDKAKAEAGVLLAERWVMARLRNERFTALGRGQPRHREAARLAQRPALQEDRRDPAVRGTRPARPGTPAGDPLRAGHLATGQGEHRLPRRGPGPGRPALLLGPIPPGGRGGGPAQGAGHGGDLPWPPPGGIPPAPRDPGYSTDPAHMPESHRRHAEWTPSRILSWARRTGPATAKLAEAIMAARPHPEQGFRSCLGIMRLGNRYGADRLEAACTRALAVRAHSYRSVESILKAGLDQRPLPPEGPPPSHPGHENLRGPSYYR